MDANILMLALSSGIQGPVVLPQLLVVLGVVFDDVLPQLLVVLGVVFDDVFSY
jgi:uncharacterized membrane protein